MRKELRCGNLPARLVRQAVYRLCREWTAREAGRSQAAGFDCWWPARGVRGEERVRLMSRGWAPLQSARVTMSVADDYCWVCVDCLGGGSTRGKSLTSPLDGWRVFKLGVYLDVRVASDVCVLFFTVAVTHARLFVLQCCEIFAACVKTRLVVDCMLESKPGSNLDGFTKACLVLWLLRFACCVCLAWSFPKRFSRST